MDPLLLEVPERIETERLILRCPRPGDGPTVNEAERETLQELKPWMPWAQTAKSLDESESYCRRMQARYLLREDGYWRRRGFGGQGYITEAARGLARLAFDRLGARRVEIRTDDGNSASWKVAERAGFTLEALLRGDSLTPAGEVRSTRA